MYMLKYKNSLLKKYSLYDLVVYGMYALIDKIDENISGLLFWFKCKLNKVELKGGYKVWGRVVLRRFPGSKIVFGNDIYLVNRPGRYSFNIIPQTLIRTYSHTSYVLIGNNVQANSVAIFCRSQIISIGDRTLIGGNCQIMDSDGHPLWPTSIRINYPGHEFDQPVAIGDDVYIGLNVIILKGSIIGSGSVIGAGSVVSGVIPPNCIAAGAPARVIRFFDGS